MYGLEMICINIIKQKYLNNLKMSLQNIFFLESINLIARLLKENAYKNKEWF